ncbi:MAG: fructose-bisphosphate aldolase class I [Candidatus Eremiobacteraeota bacterium]|nr:fructose-bisphosphate aldolase class I [Candidatus Eremiobacteraeota bacterium]
MSRSLRAVAQAIVAPGKGLLAADESTGTANKRFEPLGIPLTAEMRRRYRNMLFTTPDFGEAISGVILYDETIRQHGNSGASFVDILEADGSMPGIKLDAGTVPLALATPDEKITEGLDGLAKRVAEYVALGATFAKWRAVIAIDTAAGMPSEACLRANAHALARYAAICQAGGLVPIVEPEVLMDGAHAAHSLETSFEVHERTLRITFEELASQNIRFEEMILKPSMVIPGQKFGTKASRHEVADATLTVLLRWVPAAVAGIAFLSGGQGDEDATAHLGEINVLARERHAPWPLTFSYGRALQHAALNLWKGDDANVAAAQAAFAHRAKMNGLAALGKWTPDAEKQTDLMLAH